MFKRLLTKEVTDFHPIFEAISHGKIGWIKAAKDYVHTRSIYNDTPLLIAVKTAWNNDSITLHLKLMKVIRLLYTIPKVMLDKIVPRNSSVPRVAFWI